MRIENYSLDRFVMDTLNPRRAYDPKKIERLAANLLSQKQIVPVITVLQDDGQLLLIDGNYRFQAALVAKLKELSAVALSTRPTREELLGIQLSIDQHRQTFTLFERSSLLAQYKQAGSRTTAELAKVVGMEQGTVSKFLAVDQLPNHVKDALQAQGCDLERAYLISQEPDTEKQLTLANEAKQLSRSELRKKIKRPSTQMANETPVSRATFLLPEQTKLIVTGPDLTQARLLALLKTFVQQTKQALADSLDIKTFQRILADKAKGEPSASP